jgi:hypothetical protein
MKILGTTENKILFFGRQGFDNQTVNVLIRDEQSNKEVVNENVNLQVEGIYNFVEPNLDLNEGQYYELVISKDGVTIYRNKIFVTDSDYSFNAGRYETNITDNEYITL